MSLAITLHVLSVVIWVGGMFFAYMILRPVAAGLLEPPQRLTLWSQIFSGFFPWVWLCVITILASGLWITFQVFAGFATVGFYVHIMFLLGIIMMALFMYVYFVPYTGLKQAVEAANWPQGGEHLNLVLI
ncbi:MAG: CopD family protein, partial [Gammaproteobacteria bacterium]|nr:CopD family protein [Gammaproteobacteria bacterium]